MAGKLFIAACLVLTLQVTLSQQSPGNRKIRQAEDLDELLAQILAETSDNPSVPAPETPGPIGSAPVAEPVCMAGCLLTPEYNPVCGSDDKNYDNESKFNCSVSCGLTGVSLRHRGKCIPETFDTPETN